MKFLITGANGDIARSICRIIKNEYKRSVVHGTDINEKGPGEYLYDKIYKVSHKNNLNYLNKIKKISKNYKIIIPTTENEISFFSKNKKHFEKKLILINSNKIIENFSTKLKTYKMLKKYNFGVPSFSLRLDWVKKFNKSFFIKTNIGHGNRNYKLIKSRKDFEELKNLNKKDWIAQEFLDKNYDEYTCAVIQLGTFKDVIILNRRLDKGYTYFAEVVDSNYLKNILIKLAKIIKLNGSINVQLKINKKRYAIFEINPRLSSTVMMRHKIGFKDCIWWVNFVVKNKIPKTNYKIKKKKIIKFVDEKFI